MKRWIGLGVVVALVGLALVVWLGMPRASSPVPTAETPPPRPGDAFALTVASVWDGDTLRATVDTPNDLVPTTDEVRIRLIGIDTPELTPGEECGAIEARDALRALLPDGSTVWAAPDLDPVDGYGRLLLYLWTDDGRFVNYELVATGAAEAIRVAPNDAHFELLSDAEASARAAGAGQWATCLTRTA